MDEQRLQSLLHTPVRVYAEADSTNRLALEWARAEAPHGALVVADSQRAGRGRMNRRFFSPSGGLYMSLVLDASPEHIGHITTLAAVSVCRAVESLGGQRLSIKWVNDCLYGGRKVCGILAEGLLQAAVPRCVVGIGLNVGPMQLPEGLQQSAAALYQVPPPFALEEMAAGIATELLSAYPKMPAHMDAYRVRCVTLGQAVRFVQAGQTLEGIAQDVDDSGALLIETTHGLIRLASGEASVRGIDGRYA